jgi:hypothetical protein
VLIGARENDNKVVQDKVVQNLIMYIVAIDNMYYELVIFSLLYCIDG